MASAFQKLTKFLHSPQGSKATEQIKRAARDPRNRQRAHDAVLRIRKRAARGRKASRP